MKKILSNASILALLVILIIPLQSYSITETTTSWEDNFTDLSGIFLKDNITQISGDISLEKPIGACWWDDNWNYVVPINVSNTAGDLTDYQVKIEKGLVGSWHFSENEGTIAKDSSGHRNDGILTDDTVICANGICPTWVSGKIDSGLQFDGINDYVVLPHSDDFISNDGTAELWFNTFDLSLGRYGLFSKDSSGLDTGGHLTFFLIGGASPNIETRFQSTTGSYYVDSTGYAPITVNTWYHQVFTFGTDGMKLYLNGIEVDSDPYTGGTQGNEEPIGIGVNTWITDDKSMVGYIGAFEGIIDEVRMYNRALSAEEVNAHYEAGLQNIYADEDYRYIDASGTTEIEYWNENDDIAWVKVPFLKNNANTTTFMYYGNPLATSKSSRKDVLDYKIYNFIDTTNNKAYYGKNSPGIVPVPVDRTTWDVPGAEFDSDNYTTVSSSDNGHVSVSADPGLTQQVVHDFVFKIDENTGNIYSMNISWEGYGSKADETGSENDLRMYLFNKTASSFEIKGSKLDNSCPGPADCTMDIALNSSALAGDYIDGAGNVRIVVQKYENGSEGSSLYTDYVEVGIEHRKSASPEPVLSIVPMSLSPRIERGELTSISISLPFLQKWDRFYADDTILTDTSITYDLLNSSDGAILCAGLGYGDDISFCAASTQSIKLYANLTTLNASRTPLLHKWSISWMPAIAPPPPLSTEAIVFLSNTNGNMVFPLGSTNTVFITVKNPSDNPMSVPLHIGSQDDIFRNLIRFRHTNIDPHNKNVILMPGEEQNIPITLIAGKTGRYELIVGPDNIYENRYDSKMVSIVFNDDGLFSATPGLRVSGLIIILLFVPIFFWCRK